MRKYKKVDRQNQIEKNKNNKNFIPKSCDFVYYYIEHQEMEMM